jgi:hypothetical protein
VKICPKCRERYPDAVDRCNKCYCDLIDKASITANARITVTITKPVYAALAREAQDKNMVLSEYAALLLRARAVLVVSPDKETKKKVISTDTST